MINKQTKVEHFQFWILNSIEFRLNELAKQVKALHKKQDAAPMARRSGQASRVASDHGSGEQARRWPPSALESRSPPENRIQSRTPLQRRLPRIRYARWGWLARAVVVA